MAFFQDLKARGLVFQTTGDEQFEAWLSDKPRTLYCGFDPTADSLHIGSLVPLLMLRRFQLAGHTPIALVGGATGLIGDPSFKAQERALNTPEVVSGWVSRLRTQMSQFLSFEGDASAVMANNLDWTANVDVLTFLRDVGKHFSVNNMIAKESVKQRIEREGAGISFTEFTYMILQSFDFAQLNKRYGCELQIGGSDQWGNITGGVDLTRRMNSAQVQGLTMPLVTKADGTKFGKTESGTIWLDAKKTSPYAFYQFWLSTADADVYTFLKYFTFLSVSDIDALEQEDAEREGRPQAQKVLAQEVTRLVHTDVGLEAAERITQAMFNGEEGALSESDLAQLSLDGLPSSSVARAELPATLTQLLTDAGMVTSGKQVKDALGRSAVVINGKPVSVDDNANPQKCFAIDSAMHGQYFITRLGKKKVHLFTVV
ncbi:tyrosine--tRNA ligase [Luminiphilus sp.]|jgi:tyrosyl-tRNA synthetase|nr:tyrosine--tRNA ligase [Luminiphilus sp.]MDA8754626.1 tyrosine--tRNA ligase [Luminiphilus sp.]MDA8946622.1 tyrosine--tRNA ligase [Luminiphilus sp.]MDB2313123.1 tyrosine--tRNA ligase [Luminiphilus sp.]MDB2378121.1 tyrosine--tRNA ligase [Luminiphilus sp.]